MDDAPQAFRPLSPDQEALAYTFATEHLLPFRRHLGDAPAMTAVCDVMVHPLLDLLADTLVATLVAEDVEDLEETMAIARTWAESLPIIFLTYVRQRAKLELEE